MCFCLLVRSKVPRCSTSANHSAVPALLLKLTRRVHEEHPSFYTDITSAPVYYETAVAPGTHSQRCTKRGSTLSQRSCISSRTSASVPRLTSHISTRSRLTLPLVDVISCEMIDLLLAQPDLLPRTSCPLAVSLPFPLIYDRESVKRGHLHRATLLLGGWVKDRSSQESSYSTASACLVVEV